MQTCTSDLALSLSCMSTTDATWGGEIVAHLAPVTPPEGAAVGGSDVPT